MAVGDKKRAIGRKPASATVPGGLKPESTPGVSPTARAAAARTDRGTQYSLQSRRTKRRNVTSTARSDAVN
jgi:hypothetical protein